MTKSEPIDVLRGRFSVQLNKPATVEEFDNAIGEAGSCLESGSSDVFYRNTLPRLYKGVVAALGVKKQQATDSSGKGVTRKTGKGDAEKEVEVLENDIAAIERVLAAGDVSEADVEAAFKSVSDALPFYEKGVGGGGGKIPQTALDSANGILAGGEENVESKVEIIENAVPGYKITRDADGSVSVEALARGIVALNKHLVAEAARTAKGKLGL